MTTFHLVRHAAHGHLGRVLTGRTSEVPLTYEGRVQAAALAQRLASAPVSAVLSSPRERAQETAAPVAARLSLAVGIEQDLDEIDFGAWNGMAFDALAPQPAWQAWNRSRSMATPPDGEPMLAVQARAIGLVTRLHREHPDAEFVLVSHSDLLKAVLAHALGVPLDLLHRIELGPASRSVLVLSGHDVRIDAINLPPGA